MHKEEDLEEEFRLMYVAATRVRKNLIFTYPTQMYDRMMDGNGAGSFITVYRWGTTKLTRKTVCSIFDLKDT